MSNGYLLDRDITSSSVQNVSTPAKNARLHYTAGSSWCASITDSNPYLQIDLERIYLICAVATQGNSQSDQWVKKYTLNSSTERTTWTSYQEKGVTKVSNYRCLFTFIYNCERTSLNKKEYPNLIFSNTLKLEFYIEF